MLQSIHGYSLSAQTLSPFRSSFALDIFRQKYAHEGASTWDALARSLVDNVMRGLVPDDVVEATFEVIRDMKFIPGGRYLYYANRALRAWNNCFLFRSEEDSREDWARISWQAESALMTGGGIGNDYSIYRARGSRLGRTGGQASGPVPKMLMVNEIGRHVMQGGSRRSAIWAGLKWSHDDIQEFMAAKDWYAMPVGNTGFSIGEVKEQDFNFPAPLDMTNISVLYDDAWLGSVTPESNEVFAANCRQALTHGEPGFAFNFGSKSNETLRNACTEVTSEDDSDVCNLGSLNLSRIDSIRELAVVTELATAFLLCGTIRATLPYEKIYQVREKNRRLGLGLMGVHEWLLQRGLRYEVTPELHQWLGTYEKVSDHAAIMWAYKLDVSAPVAVRSIAPTGTIGLIAGTTTGIEPLYAVAYKRRYLKNGTDWHYQYVVDSTAELLIDSYGLNPEGIETAVDLGVDVERRIKFQADVQDYVDMAISSTINLPPWGSDFNNEDHVVPFANILAKYASRLRGFTCYPDGSRGGQPLTTVPYHEARGQTGMEFKEHDSCKGGVCGI